MGGSLFLVVGPVNIGALLGNRAAPAAPPRSSTNRPNGSKGGWRKTRSDEAAAAVADAGPDRRRQRAGRSRPGDRGAGPSPPEASERVRSGLGSLEPLPEAGRRRTEPDAAQLVAATFFSAGRKRRPASATSKRKRRQAAKAQQIAAEQRAEPRLAQHPGDLPVLQRRIRRRRQDDQAGGGRSRRPRRKRKNVEKQLAEYRKRGQEIRRNRRRNSPKCRTESRQGTAAKTRSAASRRRHPSGLGADSRRVPSSGP